MKKHILWCLAMVTSLSAGAFAACTDCNDTSEGTSYTVSFETNGGTAVESVKVEEGVSVQVGDYLTSKDGYYFYSWCFDADLEDRAPNSFVPTQDTKLYAEWGEEEMYLLSFETGEGSAIESVLYKPNAYLAEPETPSLDNYEFAGWYKDEDYTREFSFFGNTMPRRSMTVYAKWTELFAIRFDSKGGSEVEALTGEVGEAVSAPENPVKEGYVFEGWFEDEECLKPYEIKEIPEKTVTLYAKWHEQVKDIPVRLHLNNELVQTDTFNMQGNEGEELNDEEAIAEFLRVMSVELKSYFLDDTLDLLANPVYKFNGWAYDPEGMKRFDGVLPQAADGLDLYATWSRSSKYSQVKFLSTEEGGTDTLYYVVKNTSIPNSIVEAIETPLQERYQPLGCNVDGFYTSAGLRYVSGQKVVMDMELSPYLYSVDLVYEYMAVTNASGSTVNGYVVYGYDPASKIVSKDADSLILNIPEYYDDGENGSKAVLWISKNAFQDYPVTQVSLPKRLLGIGDEAFRNTKIQSVQIPSSVYELDDYVFADCAALETVTFKGSSISWLGSKIFKNTLYETQMPRDDDGFIYFNANRTIIYGYEGTATEITTPEKANVIAGGAFKGDTTLKKVTLHDNVSLACDSAFEGSAIEEIVFGKYFRSIGANLFKDCVNLETVTFTYAYNITYLGTGMFQGCTALNSIDLSELIYLQLINPYAFYGCTNLSEVNIPRGQMTSSGVVSNFAGVGQYAFANCTKLYTISFPTSLVLLDSHCFENSAISSVSLSSNLSVLGEYAFANCDNLMAVNLRSVALTTIEKGVFMGCDGLRYAILSDRITEVKDSAFEACTNLLYVDFGTSDSAVLTSIGSRVFADCTSLRKIVINGALKNDQPVTFGNEVFLNAGYTLSDQVFRTPVIYVKAGAPDFSTTSQWKNGNVMYSYVEIYSKAFEDTEYASMTLKPIDRTAPVITVSTLTLYLESSEEMKAFDLLTYFQEIDLYTVTDNDSRSEDCDVAITSVQHISNGQEVTVSATEGKYDLSALGTYAVTLVASDEFGNTSQVKIQIVVSTSKA